MPRARFAEMSVEELKREVLRRQRTLPQLVARREALDLRRKALDQQISELQDLGEVLAVAMRAKGKPGKKRTGKTRGMTSAGSLAHELAEVFQGRKSPSIAEETFLGDKNRFRASLGVDKDGPPPGLADENGKACAALSMEKERPKLRLADENRAAPEEDKDDPKLHLADENGKFVWSTNVIM